MATYHNPVYRDTFITSTADTLNYDISIGDSTIFSGKAWRMPGQEMIKVNVNKVCQDYLRQDLDEILAGATAMTNTNAIQKFAINGDYFVFLYCYDKDFLWTGGTATLSEPVSDVYAPGCMRLETKVEYQANNTIVRTYARTPENVDDCSDYALYYVGARGGWNTLAVMGTGIKTDNITQYTMDKAFDNTTREFEYSRYISEIRTKWLLNTGYLTDEQSDNIAKNLISSNLVYFHNLKDGTISPAVITDTQAVYQSYQTNGLKPCQWKINIQLSQSSIRR